MFSSSHICLSMVIILVHFGHSSNISYLLVHGDYLLSPCPWWLFLRALIKYILSYTGSYPNLSDKTRRMFLIQVKHILYKAAKKLHCCCLETDADQRCTDADALMISSSKLAMLMLVSFTVQNLQCWCCCKDLSQHKICNADAHHKWQAGRTVLRTQLIDLQALDW